MAGIVWISALALLAGELLLHFTLFLLSRFIGKQNKDKITRTSILKGVIERFFVVTTVFLDLASALTLLGALKIATRIKDAEDKVSNDFFLMGNLVSILFGIGYCIFLKRMFESVAV